MGASASASAMRCDLTMNMGAPNEVDKKHLSAGDCKGSVVKLVEGRPGGARARRRRPAASGGRSEARRANARVSGDPRAGT